MKSNLKTFGGRILSILFAIFLTACGSGGGGGGGGNGGGGGGGTPPTQTQTLSGVAAAGLPIAGYVYLKDSASNTQGPNPIASDGNFSFDVTGLTAPFYLRAEGSVAGTSYNIYSATTGAGTANINPLTNLAVAAAAGVMDPSSVYGNPAQTPITQANLDQAVTDIQNMLAPLLTAYNANINPITGAYTANHTGLDAVLDVVNVNINTATGAVTVDNAATGATIASGTTTNLSTDAVTPAEVPSTQIITDLQAIQTMFSNLAAVMNKGANLTAADLDPFFATNYGINEGFDRTQTINNQVSDFQGWTKTITSMNITIKAMGADYKVDGIAYFSDGSSGFWDEGAIVTSEGGSWKLKGNGYKSEIKFGADTTRQINADNTVQTESDFHVHIDDNGNYGLQSAKITGPGLPAGGLTLSKPANEPVRLRLDTQYRNSAINNWCHYVMSDTTIASIPDNSIYTIEIYDANGGLIETRTRKIAKRPFMISELTNGHFPTLGGITSHSISAANIGGALTFTYAKPTAFLTTWLDAGLSFWDNSGNDAWYDTDLLLNQSSGSIISGMPSWTPTGGELRIQAEDEYHRGVEIRWMMFQ